MREGRSLVDLAGEVERQAKSKRDFVASSQRLEFTVAVNGTNTGMLKVGEAGEFAMEPIAHEQVAGRLGIPGKYYDRMLKDAPGLLTYNVNHWLLNEPSDYMVRTLDGKARAVLSSKYRPLDNYDLLEAVLPAVQASNCQVRSCEVTQENLYLKCISTEVEVKLAKVGDVIRAGFMIRNSEVGRGMLEIKPFSEVLRCTNGMVHDQYAMNKRHIGRSGSIFEEVQEWYKDETRAADDRAFFLKVRDTIAHFFDNANFEEIVRRLEAAAENKIIADPVKVVEVTQKRMGWTERERNGVLTHLLAGGDLSQYGLAQATTRHSQDIDNYERATQFERDGGRIIELPRRDWETIAVQQ